MSKVIVRIPTDPKDRHLFHAKIVVTMGVPDPAPADTAAEPADNPELEARVKKLCEKNEKIINDNRRVSQMDDDEFDALKAIPLMRTNIRLYAEAQVLKSLWDKDDAAQLTILDWVIHGAQKMIQDLNERFDNWLANAHDFSTVAVFVIKSDVEKKMPKVRADAEHVLYMGDQDYDPEKAYGSMWNAYALYMKCRYLCEYARKAEKAGAPNSDINQDWCSDVAAMAYILYQMLHNRFLWVLFGQINYAGLMADAASLHAAIHDVDSDFGTNTKESDEEDGGGDSGEESPTEENPAEDIPVDKEQQAEEQIFELAKAAYELCTFPYNKQEEGPLFAAITKAIMENEDIQMSFILETARTALLKMNPAASAVEELETVTKVNDVIQQANRRCVSVRESTHILEDLFKVLESVRMKYGNGSDLYHWAWQAINAATSKVERDIAGIYE